MPYSINSASFRSVRHAHGVGLLAKCYATCVHLELCLKSDPNPLSQAGRLGHNVPEMLRQVAATPVAKRTIVSLAAQLETHLRNLHCQDPSQNAAKVDSRNYPHIRYLRHTSDWPGSPDVSSDSELYAVLTILDQIMATIRPPNTVLPL